MKKKSLLAVCLALLLLAVGCGAPSSGSVTPPAASDSAAVPSSSLADSAAADSAPEEAVASQYAYETTYAQARTYTDSLGTVWVQVIVEIENTGNCDLYLSTGSCDLEDATGKLVKSLSMVSSYPDVLSPGEKGYLYEETMLDEAVDGALTVLARPSVEKAKISNTRLATSEVELLTDSIGFLKARGRVENTTDEAQNMVYVVLILKDGEGTPVGLLFTILSEELAPGDKIGFEASGLSLPDDVTVDSVASFEVYAYPMQMQF